MKMSVAPSRSANSPHDSSARTTVVPTATTRPAPRMAAAASAEIENLSACILCSSTFSTFTGRNVPMPTCNVMNA